MLAKMIEEVDLDSFIFSDGQILSLVCNFADSIVEIKITARKKLSKQIIPCVVCLRFGGVTEFNVWEDFATSGNYSDLVLLRQPNGQFYASFDPFGNSGEPDTRDNFVIKASHCKMEEVSSL
jgi:hypothetical protein